MVWSAPRTWVSGEVVSAAIMNAHVRDNLLAVGGAAVAWTPTLTNFTSSSTICRAWSMGKQIVGQFQFAVSGTPTGVVTFTLPTPAATNFNFALYTNRGGITGLRQGTGYRNGALYLASATTAGFVSDAAAGGWANGVPVAWANTDVWAGDFVYEAA